MLLHFADSTLSVFLNGAVRSAFTYLKYTLKGKYFLLYLSYCMFILLRFNNIVENL